MKPSFEKFLTGQLRTCNRNFWVNHLRPASHEKSPTYPLENIGVYPTLLQHKAGNEARAGVQRTAVECTRLSGLRIELDPAQGRASSSSGSYSSPSGNRLSALDAPLKCLTKWDFRRCPPARTSFRTPVTCRRPCLCVSKPQEGTPFSFRTPQAQQRC